jgi:hypothetical protein
MKELGRKQNPERKSNPQEVLKTFLQGENPGSLKFLAAREQAISTQTSEVRNLPPNHPDMEPKTLGKLLGTLREKSASIEKILDESINPENASKYQEARITVRSDIFPHYRDANPFLDPDGRSINSSAMFYNAAKALEQDLTKIEEESRKK